MARNSSLSGYVGENIVAVFAVSFCYLIFFILSSKQGYIIFRISLFFSQIRPQTLELAALDRLVYNVRNVLFDISPLFFNGSSSFLQVTGTTIMYWISLHFWPDPTSDCLISCPCVFEKKAIIKCCCNSSAFIFDWIFFILGSNKDNHNISHEFEFRPDLTADCEVNCPRAFGKNPQRIIKITILWPL